jgi:hypothetical protein
MKILAKVFISLMLLPAVAIPQEKPTAQVILSGAVKPILGEWNFAFCGAKEFSTFHATVTDDKNGSHQTFAYAMNGPDLVEGMGADSLRYDIREVTVRDTGEVQYVLTHTYLSRTTKKLTVESEIDENLYNGHLIGALISIPDKVTDKVTDKQDQQQTDALMVYATPGTLDSLPAFSEPAFSLCKDIRTQTDEQAEISLLNWAEDKPPVPHPVLPPAQKTLPDLPPVKEPTK